jgi:hypothetical protein
MIDAKDKVIKKIKIAKGNNYREINIIDAKGNRGTFFYWW